MCLALAQQRYDLRLQVCDGGVGDAELIGECRNLLLQYPLALRALIKLDLASVRRRVRQQQRQLRGPAAAAKRGRRVARARVGGVGA